MLIFNLTENELIRTYFGHVFGMMSNNAQSCQHQILAAHIATHFLILQSPIEHLSANSELFPAAQSNLSISPFVFVELEKKVRQSKATVRHLS